MLGARLLVAVVSLLFAPSLLLPSQGDELAAQSRRGKDLMAAGRYAEAAVVYRELVKAVPGNPGLLLDLGMALHLSGQDQEALAPLQAAERLQPRLLPAALLLGAVNLRLGRAAAAVAPLQKAVRLQPDNREARSMLAEALVDLERYADAEPHLRRLAQTAPSDPAAWFNLGKVYEALAGQAFERLLKRDPESPLALALVADARLKQDQRTAAFHLYRQAIDRAPGLRGLHGAVAAIYRRAGHPDWAAVEEERERGLPRPDCSRETLECGFAAARHREVVASASKLSSPEACYWLVRSYNELAVQAFARLAALPASVESHEWLAGIHRSERRYLESAEEWRQAMALAPRDPRLKTELAITLRLGRDFPAARQVLEEILRAEPDSPEASALLGDVLLALEEPERAIPVLEKAVRLDEKSLPAHGALGRAYALVGRASEAIPHLRQALPADTDGSLRYQLARSYQAAGQAELAGIALKDYEEFKKASSPGPEAYGQGAPITPPR